MAPIRETEVWKCELRYAVIARKRKETALLMKLGKVDRFDNGVFCVYAMQQRDGPV